MKYTKQKYHSIKLPVAPYILLLLLIACDGFVFERPNSLDGETQTTTSEIVLLLYVNGDNSSEQEILSILNEIETIRSIENINVIALVDRISGGSSEDGDWTGTRAYRIKYDEIVNTELLSARVAVEELGLTTSSDTELNMGSSLTLERFINYGKRVYGTNSSKIVLAVIGEGGSWNSIGNDTSESPDDALTISELANALEKAGTVEYLLLDHIPMSIELWYEIGAHANYIASAPTVSSSIPTWGYKNLVKGVIEATERSEQATSLASAIRSSYTGTRLSIVQGSGASSIQQALDSIGREVTKYISTPEKQKEIASLISTGGSVEMHSSSSGESFVDIESFAKSMQAITGMGSGTATAYQSIAQANSSGVIDEKQAVANSAGVMVYVGTKQSDGSYNIAEEYNSSNTKAVLEYVQKTRNWSANSENKTGMLYKIFEEEIEELLSKDIVTLLYLNGDSNIEQDIMNVVNQIETIEGIESHPVLVLIDRVTGGNSEGDNWTSTRAYRIKYDAIVNTELQSERLVVEELGLTKDKEIELNMGASTTLQQFVNYGKRKYGTSESKIVVGILGQYSRWDNISEDSSEVSTDGLEIAELGNAIRGAGGVDYLLLEHMPMSMELWYEVGSEAEYIVSSPKMTPTSPQWNYKELVKKLIGAVGNTNIDEAIQAGIFDSYGGSKLTMVQGSGASSIQAAIDKIGNTMSNYISTAATQTEVHNIIIGTNSSVVHTYLNPGAYFVDIESMAKKFGEIRGVSSTIQAEYQKLVQASSGNDWVIKEKHTASDEAGVLIYTAELQSSGDSNTVAAQYIQNTVHTILKFVQETRGWSVDSVGKRGLLYKLWLANDLP